MQEETIILSEPSQLVPVEPEPDKPQKVKPIKKEFNIKRNEKCFCGSGKKYKKCHRNSS